MTDLLNESPDDWRASFARELTVPCFSGLSVSFCFSLRVLGAHCSATDPVPQTQCHRSSVPVPVSRTQHHAPGAFGSPSPQVLRKPYNMQHSLKSTYIQDPTLLGESCLFFSSSSQEPLDGV